MGSAGYICILAAFFKGQPQTNAQKTDSAQAKHRTTGHADRNDQLLENSAFTGISCHLFILHDRILMNDDICCWDGVVDIVLDFLGHPVGIGQEHTPLHLKMKLDYLGLT